MSVSAISIIEIVIMIGGTIAAFTVAILRVFYQLGQIRLKVDTMWDFLIRRGTSELVQKGWGQMNSPFEISGVAIQALMPFLDQFLPFYAALASKGLRDGEMAYEFERRFGDFILEKICVPNLMSAGACLVAILKVCEKFHADGAMNGC